MKLRDNINKEFQKKLNLSAIELVLAAIVKSYKQQNIVLITIANYNADFLIQHKNIWQESFKFEGLLQDKVWHKVVAHGISTEIFNFSKGLDLLKEEIKIFNRIQPVAVNWLSSSQNREQKKHGSIVIAFDNKAYAEKALKNQLLIAGITIQTAIFEEKEASKQYLKYQKFGHITNSCKNIAVCQYCAQNHLTRLHICKICETTGQICIHTQLKCSNCMGRHAANSKECNIVIASLAKKLNPTQNTNQTSQTISQTSSQTIDQASSQNSSQDFSFNSSLKSAFNLLADEDMEEEIEDQL